MTEIELLDGTILKGRVLARTLFCAIIRCEDGSFKLLSKFACKDPESIHFINDNN